MAILVALYIRRRDQNRINRDAHPVHLLVNLGPEIRIAALLDDEEIYVAVPRHVASGGGAEENNPLRLRDLHDAPDDVI